MSPQDRQRFEALEKKVSMMYQAHDVAFIESLARRLADSFEIPTRLSDLSDVSGTDSASTGQVLKKTSTTWQPGTDNTGV
jgi:hypothetical protein